MRTGRDRKKVLIIKLGYSETLDSSLSLTTSLGDVLRTTVILHFFKDCRVTWLVDEKAGPLLEGNDHIDELLVYASDIGGYLKKEKFDIVVNLEKIPEVCALSDSLSAAEYYGFRLNGLSDDPGCFYSGSGKLMEIATDLNKKRLNRDCWQKVLSEIVDKPWAGQEYILGYEPVSETGYDIGFNWTTGDKWSNKSWPRRHWDKLEKLIDGRYSVSWQKGMNSIYEYIDWINSCRLIITADTLGLHLALVLKKRVIALFGPTSPYEIYFYNLGTALIPELPYECIPCLNPVCRQEKECMEYLLPEKVIEEIEKEFKKDISS